MVLLNKLFILFLYESFQIFILGANLKGYISHRFYIALQEEDH